MCALWQLIINAGKTRRADISFKQHKCQYDNIIFKLPCFLILVTLADNNGELAGAGKH